MFTIQKYDRKYHKQLLQFMEICLPQSGRSLELNGRHKMFNNIEEYFVHFWCMFDGENVIGTVALKALSSGRCELKALYLLEQYHKRGLGRRLLKTAIQEAKQEGYKEIYLDTLSSSKKAIHLYEKAGFVRTERYNNNYAADVFMVLKLDAADDCKGREQADKAIHASETYRKLNESRAGSRF